jgi:phospholipid/cholesterol/gamma-HCH transport system permease protein
MLAPLSLVFFRQIYYTGVQSAGIVMLLAAIVGGGFVFVFQSTLAITGAAIVDLLSALMVKVFGVVFTLLIIAARSISAISTELATIRVTGEGRSLNRLGVDANIYLLVPRFLATFFSGGILYLYFVFTSLLTGSFLASRSFGVEELTAVLYNMAPGQVLLGMLRASVFAGLSILYVFFFSIRKARRFPDIPLAASNGVFQAIVLMLLLELSYQSVVIFVDFGLATSR